MTKNVYKGLKSLIYKTVGQRPAEGVIVQSLSELKIGVSQRQDKDKFCLSGNYFLVAFAASCASLTCGYVNFAFPANE